MSGDLKIIAFCSGNSCGNIKQEPYIVTHGGVERKILNVNVGQFPKYCHRPRSKMMKRWQNKYFPIRARLIQHDQTTRNSVLRKNNTGQTLSEGGKLKYTWHGDELDDKQLWWMNVHGYWWVQETRTKEYVTEYKQTKSLWKWN